MSGRKRIIKLASKIMEILDLPEEAMGACVKITMLKNEHLLIENHMGIYEIFEENIKVSSDMGIISVRGKKLSLKEISAERLYVSGQILGIDVE